MVKNKSMGAGKGLIAGFALSAALVSAGFPIVIAGLLIPVSGAAGAIAANQTGREQSGTTSGAVSEDQETSEDSQNISSNLDSIGSAIGSIGSLAEGSSGSSGVTSETGSDESPESLWERTKQKTGNLVPDSNLRNLQETDGDDYTHMMKEAENIRESLELVENKLGEEEKSFEEAFNELESSHDLFPTIRNDLVKIKEKADEEENFEQQIKKVLKEERIDLRHLQQIEEIEQEVENKYEKDKEKLNSLESSIKKMLDEQRAYRKKKEVLLEKAKEGEETDEETKDELNTLMENLYELNQDLRDMQDEVLDQIQDLENSLERLEKNLDLDGEFTEIEEEEEEIKQNLEQLENRENRLEKFPELKIDSVGGVKKGAEKASILKGKLEETAGLEEEQIEAEEEGLGKIEKTREKAENFYSGLRSNIEVLKEKLSIDSRIPTKIVKKTKQDNRQIGRFLESQNYDLNESKSFEHIIRSNRHGN